MPEQSVLVVDDEKNIRLSLSRTLESAGIRVDTAVNGEEALQKLDADAFSLLLLDLRLPGMDGLEALRRVRQRWPDLSVVIISAVGTVDSAVQAMKLGAADFIQKPFSPEEIRTVVMRVLACRPGSAGSDGVSAPSTVPQQEDQP